MAKTFKILLMVFCLGIFIFPKQVFVVENIEMSCYKTEKSEKKEQDCCAKSEKAFPCKESKNKHHSCDGNCNNCNSCSFTVVFLRSETHNPIAEIPQNIISKKVENFYLTPHISQLSKAIWQPPKIS